MNGFTTGSKGNLPFSLNDQNKQGLNIKFNTNTHFWFLRRLKLLLWRITDFTMQCENVTFECLIYVFTVNIMVVITIYKANVDNSLKPSFSMITYKLK